MRNAAHARVQGINALTKEGRASFRVEEHLIGFADQILVQHASSHGQPHGAGPQRGGGRRRRGCEAKGAGRVPLAEARAASAYEDLIVWL